VAHNLDTRIGKFEELLIGRAEAVTREIETKSRTAAELLAGRMDQLTAAIKTNSSEAAQSLEQLTASATQAIRASAGDAERTVTSAATTSSESIRSTSAEVERSLMSLSTGVTSVLKQNAGEVERTLLGVSSEVARNLVGRADEIAAAVGKRSAELSKVLDDKSSGLLAGISSKTDELAVQIGRVTEQAVQSIQTKAFAFTGTMLDNSNELARLINDASQNAVGAINQAGASTTEAVSRTVKELHDKTNAAVEQSRQTATVTVAELLETHGMLRSDTTTMFERLREANGLLQAVLSGAQDNLGSIEHMLSTRVTEFVATMNQLLERTDSTTGRMDDHIGSFYGLTTKALGDLGELAAQFDRHGRSLVQAVEVIEVSNRRADDTIGSRRAALDTLITGLDARTGDLDARLKRFSGLLDETLAAAEARARDIARVVADATAEGTRAIADQHEAVRVTVEQERARTGDALRGLYQQATNEAHMLFRENANDAKTMLQEAKDRFADTVSGIKQMANEMQRELDATRQELRRGILELPQETAESASQMRRVIVDQIEALAELNRIVARHGRGMDAQQPDTARRAHPEESVVVSMGGRGAARPVARNDITAPPAPTQPPPTAFAPRRSEPPAPPPAPPSPPPAGGPGGRAGSGWLTDLLSRASRDEPPRDDRPPMRPDDRPPLRSDERMPRLDDRGPRHTIESLDSLSVDIARMIDHNAAADLWDRYNRGERNVFTKRLYTMQGQKAFDEISKRYRADREFKQTVDRYIGEFERLLDEVSRDDRGQVVARTYLTSETGKVYTMLAHAAGRFD
ncbi:MAG TPA: hypothetical protein VLX44_00480, partial [Xanthobacteraceae bacterium]|nr:hypothetical protein [Xanthobacteraceae bacterium]